MFVDLLLVGLSVGMVYGLVAIGISLIYSGLDNYSLEPAADEEYQYKSTDVRAQLIKAKASKPDALMISDQSEGIAFGVKQSFEVGIPASVPRLHTSSAGGKEFPIFLATLL